MELTVEQFEMLVLRQSQEDLKLVVEVLLNDGSISAPADAPSFEAAKVAQEEERKADSEAGGSGQTAFEKKVEAAEEAAAAQAKAEKEAAKQAEKDAKEAEGAKASTTEDVTP